MSSFHNIPKSSTHLFTDTTVDLFLDNCAPGLFSELQTSALENVTPSSELHVLPHRSSPTNCNSFDSIHSPPLCRSTWGKKTTS